MQLFKSYQAAARRAGRPLLALLWEAARLRLSPRQLGLSEYLDFRLYETDLSWPAKQAFGGQRAQAAAEALLIDDYSKFLSLDKVTMYALLDGLGLPIPRVRAVYRSARPSALTRLESLADLRAFLAAPGQLPVYVKKAFGAYGRGNALVTGFDGREVQLGSGARETLEAFAHSLDDGHPLGWIFQEPLTAHPRIAALTGTDKVSGLRIHSFLARSEPRILQAVFKINAGLRDSDNFEHGASGNMLAAVDLVSGRVLRAIQGTGLQQRELALHPHTQAPLVGFEIPHWPEVLRLVREGQLAFPGFLCPGWDLAICADGPRILEVNAFGDVDLPEHASRQGFFGTAFMDALRERGLADLLHETGGRRQVSRRNHRVGVKAHHWPW